MADWQKSVAAFLKSKTASTAALYRAALDEFRRWYTAAYCDEPDPALLTNEELREWRDTLSDEQRLAASTVNVRLAAVRGLASSCGNELKPQGVRRVLPPVQALTARELGRILKVVEGEHWTDKRDAALIAVMARAGLRVSEAVGLDLDDATLNERSGWVLVRRGKGRKERRVPPPLEARQALAAYREARPAAATSALFLAEANDGRLGRITARSVQRMVEAAAAKAGITDKEVTPHTLRHTFATRFLEHAGEGGLATLRDILGHSSIATTGRYLHADAQRMQEMVEGL